MRLWITRPEEDAGPLGGALCREGIEVLVAPLLLIVFADGPPLDITGVQALLATSANGVRAFARRNAERDMQVLAVGDATARAARTAGFAHVDNASGDVAALAELTRRRLDPARGAVLHVAASDLAGDLAAALTGAGFDYRRAVLYEARTADALPGWLVRDIDRGALDAVAVFSPRTGRTLVRLLQTAALSRAASGLVCFCLSDPVAAAVAGLPWREVVTAGKPEQASMIAAIVAAKKRLCPASAVNSLSSSGAFTASLGRTNIGRQLEGGSMSSETNKDQLAEGSKPSAPEPTGPVEPPDRSPGAAQVFDTPEAGRAARPSAEPATPEEASSPPKAGDFVSASGPEPASSGPAPAEAVAPAPTPSRGSRPLIWTLIALALIAAAGTAFYFGYVKPYQQRLTQAAPADAQAEVNAALEDLEARQVRLRQQLEGLAPRVDALERSLSALRQSVDRLSTSASPADSATLKQLGDRLTVMETQASAASGLAQQVRSLEASTAMARDTASKLASSVLAVGQLVQAVGEGVPFARQLAAVRALGGDDPDIAQAAADLEPYAGSGVPTLASLRTQLLPTIRAIVNAAPATAGGTWSDRVINQLASLVTVRRTGPQAIARGGVDGIVAQAEGAMDAGDVQAAVTALERLDGASAEAAQDWLAKARMRLAADRALATLQQRALARLTAAKG
jgi:uroporphyrinogen-III synthase